jgi:hypothetical protein
LFGVKNIECRKGSDSFKKGRHPDESGCHPEPRLCEAKDLVLIQDVSLRKPSLNMTTLFKFNFLSFFKLSHDRRKPLRSRKFSANIDGTFKNAGTVPLVILRGATAGTEGITVLPGEMWGLIKGYSTITVVNLSHLMIGSLTTPRVR